MIDTYFDRVSASLGYPQRQFQTLGDDPRYYCGQLYLTLTARNAAEARDRLAQQLDRTTLLHRSELCRRVKLDTPTSLFDARGRRKLPYRAD